ncbi:hypothetical protein OF83DRAFT_1102447 [Amylostereum chailletii]|nr:hypothetical protein OF83DRAFT_1102447 [Amylostereum chailletii]
MLPTFPYHPVTAPSPPMSDPFALCAPRPLPFYSECSLLRNSSAGSYEQHYHFSHSSDIGSSHSGAYTTASTEPIPRRRPKYTRSKTGCMTCRAKKIKCDETKPKCVRCVHGQRECTWPEGVTQRKRSTSRKQERLEYSDGRPSTASSSGLSDSSTPPLRTLTPPEVKHEPEDIGLSLMIPSRRHSAPSVTTHSHLGNVSPDHRPNFISSAPPHQTTHHHPHRHSYPHSYMSAPPLSSGLTVIPEMQPTYGHSLASLDDHRFATSQTLSYPPSMDSHASLSRSMSSLHYRPYEGGHMLDQWSQPLSHLDPVDSYSYLPRSAPVSTLGDGHRYP